MDRTHRAQISNEFNSSAVSKKVILACHGYSFEEFPLHPFTDRAISLGTCITFLLYERLAIDLFACEKLLLPITEVQINLYMISENPNVSLKSQLIVRCLLEELELLNLIINTFKGIWKVHLLNTFT